MQLVKWLASEIKRYHWWHPGTKVVVAVSTGVDSMTLLSLLERLNFYRPRIVVAHVNHELRHASWNEERYLRNYCRDHRLTLAVTHWRVSQHPSSGLENAARQFRYRFFKRVMERNRAPILLTAHHLNDQAETVLMRLIRGGDLHELTGIHRVRSFGRGYLIRPLLPMPKLCLVRYAKRIHLKYFVDATNRSLKMTRNRMRHIFLPKMASENPKILDHLGYYARQLQDLYQDNQFLNLKWLASLKVRDSNGWRLASLLKLPRFVQLGLVKTLIRRYDPRLILTPQTVDEMINLLNDRGKPQGTINLGGNLVLDKNYRHFQIRSRLGFPPRFNHVILVWPNRWYSIQSKRLGLFPLGSLSYSLKLKLPFFYLAPSDFPLRIRAARLGDRVRLKNGGHQKVRRILIDQKVPNLARKRSLVLETKSHEILALLGYKDAFIPKRNHQVKYILVQKDLKRGKLK